jgi:hypothetical protein
MSKISHELSFLMKNILSYVLLIEEIFTQEREINGKI